MVEPWEFAKYFGHRTSLSRVYLLTPAGSMEQTSRNAKMCASPLYVCMKHMIIHGILCNYSVHFQRKQSYFGPEYCLAPSSHSTHGFLLGCFFKIKSVFWVMFTIQFNHSNPSQGFPLLQNLLNTPSPLAHRDPSVPWPVLALTIPKELGLHIRL